MRPRKAGAVFAACVALVLAGSVRAQAQAENRPNILVILADDLGYSDVGSYGAVEIETPNLDRLAEGGMRFSQFYNVARCSPTRASLMTGLYPHQAGVGWLGGDAFGGEDAPPGYLGHLNDRSVTIAALLRQEGYRTMMVGKWHIGHPRSGTAPWQRGFDRYFGRLARSDYWDANGLWLDGRPYEWEAHHDEPFYMTDAQGDFAVRFIEEHAAADPGRPFFMYLAFNAPHFPLHAPADEVARYRDRFAQGWDALRAKRHARLIEQGILAEGTPLPPRDVAVPAWDDVPDDEQADWTFKMAVYAAMIDIMDRNVGRAINILEEAGRLDNTLILFLSDNGASAEDIGTGEDQIGTDAGTPPGGPGTWQHYLLPWANASNTPFRDYKHFTHEGGIATPLIVHWPAGVPDVLTGTVTGEPGHVIDVMATSLNAAAAEYPATYAGRTLAPMEGKSLLPVLRSRRREGHEMIFWEHEGNRAVREGRWKLVAYHEEQVEALYEWWQFSPRSRTRDVSGEWQLYDLKTDPTEQHDLAAQHPERAARMAAAYRAWAERTHVEDWDIMQCLHAKPKFRRLCDAPSDASPPR